MGAVLRSERDVDPLESDLTIQHSGEPIGERMVVTGRVVDGDGPAGAPPARRDLAGQRGRPLHPQARPTSRAAGPELHRRRALPDRRRRHLPFTTIKPGPYPWKNHHNAWRPAHIHFSLFGTEFTQRMITQMYFPGDPLFALDPIYQSITDQKARDRLVATYDHDAHHARVGHRVPVGHRAHRQRRAPRSRTPTRERALMSTLLTATPGQTSARSSATRCRSTGQRAGAARLAGAVRLHGVVTDGAGRPVPDALLEIWQADADGVDPDGHGSLRRDGWTFTGWGRASTDAKGSTASPPSSPVPRHAGAAPFFARRRVRPRTAQPAVHPRLPARRAAGRRSAARVAAPDRRDTLIAVTDEHGPAVRHSTAGARNRETVFLRYPGHRR